MPKEKISNLLQIGRFIVVIVILLTAVLSIATFYYKDQSQIKQNNQLIKENKDDIEDIKEDIESRNKRVDTFMQKILITLSRVETEIKYISKR